MFNCKQRLAQIMARAFIGLVLLTPVATRAQSEEQAWQQQEAASGTTLAAQRKVIVDPMLPGPLVWNVLATPLRSVRGTDGPSI